LLKRARNPKKRTEYEAELETDDFPLPLLYLWVAFNRIRRRKGGNGFGPSPIEMTDIDAFNRLSGMAFAPWEVEMIERLDDIFLKSLADAAEKDK
jgi:hypothetical protein